MDPEYWEELQVRRRNQPRHNPKNQVKGLPLIGQNEAVLGQSEGENGENHAPGQDDPFPDAENQAFAHLPAVPSELKALRQWVVWREEQRDGKPTKIPYQVNRRKAQSNHQETWVDYQTVCNHRDDFSGIGFVFSEDDPYCGIDLDNCLDDTGRMKAWAKPIVDRLKSVGYGERSPSGHGIKFWTRAALHLSAKHKVYISESTGEAIEAYDSGRYFTVTGQGYGNIRDGQQAADWLVREYLSRSTPRPTPRTRNLPTTRDTLNTDEVISHIMASKQCHKFDALMAGNTTGYGSQSEADMALCCVIAFWTQDSNTIDAIFRQSALMRSKWDFQHRANGASYGQMTIETALSGKRETYTPRWPRQATSRYLTRERYGYDRF